MTNTCDICGRAEQLRKGRCHRCNEYFRRNNRERPMVDLVVRLPQPCENCGRLRCTACLEYFRRNGRARPIQGVECPEESSRVPSYPRYLADKHGGVWVKVSGVHGDRWKLLKQQINRHGYVYVKLINSDGAKRRTVHRIILETFVGPCPEGKEACHGNGIRHDNRLANLRWDSRQENSKDKIRHKKERELEHNQ